MRITIIRGGLGVLVWSLPCLLPATGDWMGLSANTAQADGSINRLMRWTGWGWSSGYHACKQQRGGLDAVLPPQSYSAAGVPNTLVDPTCPTGYCPPNHAATGGYGHAYATNPAYPTYYPAGGMSQPGGTPMPYSFAPPTTYDSYEYQPHGSSVLQQPQWSTEPAVGPYRSAVPDPPPVAAEPSRRAPAETKKKRPATDDLENDQLKPDAEELPKPKATLEDDEDWELDSAGLNAPLRGPRIGSKR